MNPFCMSMTEIINNACNVINMIADVSSVVKNVCAPITILNPHETSTLGQSKGVLSKKSIKSMLQGSIIKNMRTKESVSNVF